MGDWIINFLAMALVAGAVAALFFAYDWIVTARTPEFAGLLVKDGNRIHPIEILLLLITIVAFVFVVYGFDSAALKIARGGRPIVNDVWMPSRFPPYLLMQVLFVSISIVAWVIPFVGPAVAWAVFLYAPYFVLDGSGSGVTSLFKSVDLATRPGLFGRQVLFGFILSLLAYLASGLLLIAVFIVRNADAEFWSSQWRNLTTVVLLAMWGVVFLISIACARMAAALAYVRLVRVTQPMEPV